MIKQRRRQSQHEEEQHPCDVVDYMDRSGSFYDPYMDDAGSFEDRCMYHDRLHCPLCAKRPYTVRGLCGVHDISKKTRKPGERLDPWEREAPQS